MLGCCYFKKIKQSKQSNKQTNKRTNKQRKWTDHIKDSTLPVVSLLFARKLPTTWEYVLYSQHLVHALSFWYLHVCTENMTLHYVNYMSPINKLPFIAIFKPAHQPLKVWIEPWEMHTGWCLLSFHISQPWRLLQKLPFLKVSFTTLYF